MTGSFIKGCQWKLIEFWFLRSSCCCCCCWIKIKIKTIMTRSFFSRKFHSDLNLHFHRKKPSKDEPWNFKSRQSPCSPQLNGENFQFSLAGPSEFSGETWWRDNNMKILMFPRAHSDRYWSHYIISPGFDEEINKLDWKPRQLPSLTLNHW